MATRTTRRKATGRTRRGASDGRGRLRIGNQWNAITIIALSQNSPLKAIAEFVENSIDARAPATSPSSAAGSRASPTCGWWMTARAFA